MDRIEYRDRIEIFFPMSSHENISFQALCKLINIVGLNGSWPNSRKRKDKDREHPGPGKTKAQILSVIKY